MSESHDHQIEICRVCRSEGTADQPLFYPCLCSGSIKYIHQDCLIEWLKHSRKKYCELCKHPFTFSPVYAEQMPKSIPVSVLIWGLIKKVFNGVRVTVSLSFSALLWFLVVPLITTQIFRYYFGWNLHEILHSALSTQDLDDYVLETGLAVGFDVIQGFIMTGFTVFLVLAMLLVREFLIMIGFDPVNTNAPSVPVTANVTTNVTDNVTANVTDNVTETPGTASNTANSSTANDETTSTTTATTVNTFNFRTDDLNALPSTTSLRSPLSPTTPLVSPLSPIRRHSEFRNGATNPAAPQSPTGNYWVEQAHPKEFRNYMKRRDLQRALMEAEQGHRPFDVETYLNDNENVPEDHVSNISGTSTIRSRFTTTSTTTTNSRESFRCRICSSNTCTSREHVIQASQMRNSLTAQRNQAVLQRAAQASVNEVNGVTGATADTANTNPTNTATANDMWNFDAAENISFPEFFGFTLQGTPLLQLLQNSAIVIGCNALFMHLFLFVPSVTGKALWNETVFKLIVKMPLFQYTQSSWKYLDLFSVEPGSFAEFIRSVVIGYSILCTAASFYLKWTGNLRDSFHRTVNPILSFVCVFIKLIALLFIEMVIFPLASGFMVDYFCLDLFPNSTFYSRLLTVRSLPISSLTIHWALGAFFMLNFASFITFSRSFLRPGLLFFLRNPQDPDSNPIKEMVERTFADQMYRLSISLVFYAVLIYSSVGLAVKILTIPSISSSIFPLNFKFHEPLIEIPIDLLFHLLLRSLVTSFSPLKLFKTLHISLQKALYRQLSLSSYFLGGGRYLSEEHFPKGGNWVAVPDFDRIYTRKRLTEIRSRVITPVDISKLKILFDKQNQPVLETSHNSSTRSSDWTAVFRPNYFKLKCLLVLSVTLFSLQTFLLTISVGPLLTGRFLVKMAQNLFDSPSSPSDVHEIYSWHVGAFALFLIVKLIEFLVIPIKKSSRRRSIDSSNMGINEKLSSVLRSAVKVTIIGFFMILIWPLQVGILFSLLINPLIQDSSDLIGNLFKIDPHSLQIPILFFGTCWSIGFPILRILFSLKSHLPLPQQTISYLRVSRTSLDQIELKQFFKLVIVPVSILFTLSILLPPISCLILVPLYFGQSSSYGLLLKYQNSSHLIVLISYLTLKLSKSFISVISRLVAGIRDENYLVGRRLHNLENRVSNNTNTNNGSINTGNISPLI